MLIYIYILCIYPILSILIAIGGSIQFSKSKSEIRFGWGISYNYIGQMHHNLNKYYVVVGLEIPDFRVDHTANHSVEILNTVTNGTLVLGLSCYLKLVKRFGQLTLVPFQNLTIVKKELNILWKKKSQLWYLTLN